MAIVRWVALAVIAVLVVAVTDLAAFADETDRRWAWTIHPHETSYFIAGGYLGGIYFFARVLAVRRWHQVALGFLAITAFVWAMSLATVIHWNRFHHGQPAMIAWTAVYAVTAVVVPGIWLLHRGRDTGAADSDDVVVPRPVRLAAGVVGCLLLAIGLGLFLRPSLFYGIWPWDLTELTGRVIGGWYLLPAVLMLGFARETRWSVWRIAMESQMLSVTALFAAALASHGDLHPTRPGTYVYLALLPGLLVALGRLHVSMQRTRSMAQARGQTLG
jgi:hypothetical protein